MQIASCFTFKFHICKKALLKWWYLVIQIKACYSCTFQRYEKLVCYLMKNAFLSFANVTGDANFVKVLTVSLLLGIWGLQLMELDTLLSPSHLQGPMLEVFDLYVRPKYFFLSGLFNPHKTTEFIPKQGCTTQGDRSYTSSTRNFICID